MNLEMKFAKLLGTKGWLTNDLGNYQTDWLKKHAHKPLGVAKPKNTDEVAKIVGLARSENISITPQGGNTSLCGGSVPEDAGQIILSMSRMNKIKKIDPINFCVEVEAGVVLASLHEQLTNGNLMFPMHLGAEGSAQIGGLISTNAGGSHAFRYGMMQDLTLGLEVVLPDGRVWNGMRALIKDNSGYQLRNFFCGAEGTLGIITKAVLRLYPAPKKRATTLLAVENYASLMKLGALLRSSLGEFINALEFFSDTGVNMALKNIPDLKFPLESRSECYLLVELSTASPDVLLDQMLEKALEQVFESGIVLDGAIAASGSQRDAFWRLREEMPEGQRIEAQQLKHDISVPISSLSQFIADMLPSLNKIMPGISINSFGHLGDGNIHFNLTPPEGQENFDELASELSVCIYKYVEQIGGSFAAEHGLGRAKISVANQLRSPVERDLMNTLKRSIDPQGTFNPGVIVNR